MIDYAKIIREEVAAAERRITQRIATMIQQTEILNPTASGNEDGASGWPDSGGSYQRTARRWQHFGFRSVPPKNAAALMALVGGGATAEVTFAEDSTGYGPDPGAEGAAIFSAASGCSVVCTKDGDTVVNGGTAKVARVGDAVKITTAQSLATWMAQVETAINVLAPGAIAPLSPTFIATPGIAISSGADHFKG